MRLKRNVSEVRELGAVDSWQVAVTGRREENEGKRRKTEKKKGKKGEKRKKVEKHGQRGEYFDAPFGYGGKHWHSR